MRWALLCALLLSTPLLAGPAQAQRARGDAVRPRAAKIYPDSDPLAKQKARVEALMGVYLVDPPRRHASERVKVKGSRVQLDIWQPVARSSDTELKTRAVQWFVFGRTGYAKGVRGIFSEMAGIDQVTMVFHEVLREGRGRKKGAETVKRYLVLRLDRRRFERMKVEALRGCVERGDCSRAFRSAFTSAKLERRYTARRRKAED